MKTGNPSARWKERSSCRGERQRSSTRFDLGRAIKTVETEQKGGWIALRSTELLGCTGSFCSFFLFAFFAFGPGLLLFLCCRNPVAAHGAADGHQDLQNLRLQMPRDLSWLGGCLAPPCRGLRPTPALCAPSRGCDEPVARHCLPRSADEVRAVRRG